MDERITALESMLDKTADLIAAVPADRLDTPTPCADYDVDGLLDHLATWVQVFDSTVNGTPPTIDPTAPRIDGDRAVIFRASADRIVAGLRDGGFERPMTMTENALPGEFVLDMLLMEYVGHGWDLSRALGIDHPYSDDEATTALAAGSAILEPQYRGTGMFDHEVEVADDAPAIDRFVAFTGRHPDWRPAPART
ncbi:MAG: TIGR03086 family metal-binding protein [Actinomycetota bacterium]|nr:TIGR03086 family metal-binding protein [Actinomycetota bacterium]